MTRQAQVVAIIAAGGMGKRMGESRPKQFLPLGGQPLIWHTIHNLAKAECIKRIVLVLRAEDMAFCREQVLTEPMEKPVDLVEGGRERSDSVYAGLQATLPQEDIVLIHDAARPFIRPTLVEKVVEMAWVEQAAIAAVPVKETIKVVEDGIIVQTPARSGLWRAQTPQAFRRALLLDAYQSWNREDTPTDEAMLVEAVGIPVRIVEGDEANIKITTPQDLAWCEWYITAQKRDK
jgi:2-C-methyl-D-erythritol 4-phosphate cytidylyltransferase